MSSNEPQRVQKVPGARRAKLTPAAGTGAETLPADDAADADAHDDQRNVAAAERNAAAAPVGRDAASARSTAAGPNDERMRQDVPPHY